MSASIPLRIAHGYGNSRRGVEAALSGPVDVIEVDLWYWGGRVWVHHERKLPLLPVFYGKRPGGRPPGLDGLSLALGLWFVRLDLNPLSLEELLQEVGDRRQLLLDLKGPCTGAASRAFVARLVDSLRRFHLEATARLCGNWPLLDQVRRTAPQLKIHYSIGDGPRYQALLLRLAQGDQISAVSLHRSLLNEERARFLRERRIEVVCWPVDDAVEAQRLIALGVDGIISYDLTLLGYLSVPAVGR